MIANEAEIWTALQIANGVVDDAERGIVQQMQKYVENKAKKFLGYDPEQKTHTEYFPFSAGGNGAGGGFTLDVNASHTHARFEAISTLRESLQLRAVPVRSITSLRVDENGRFGKGTDAFPSGSAWTEGEDFFPEYEQDGLCRSGLLLSHGSWPAEPGSVKVVYVAGYTKNELNGTLEDAADLEDASGIKGAIITGMLVSFQKWNAWKKNSRAGVGGPFQSEKAQDYSYTISPTLVSQLSMIATLPSESEDQLADFRHYGLMRT